jgi:hypothetical protein
MIKKIYKMGGLDIQKGAHRTCNLYKTGIFSAICSKSASCDKNEAKNGAEFLTKAVQFCKSDLNLSN